jgi:hypothetical protein
MSKDLFPEIEEVKPVIGTKGSSQQILLVILLFLILVFGYLYFFTSLIRSRNEAAKTIPPQTAQIRQPLPPRPDQGVEKPLTSAKQEEKGPTQVKTEKPVPPPTPPQANAPPVQVKAAPAQVRPAAVPPKPAPVKAVKAYEKPLHKEQAKAIPAPAPPAASQQKGGAKPVAATSSIATIPAPAALPHKAAKPAAEHGAYTLLVGEFAVGHELKRARAKLNKLGVTPVHTKKVEKLQHMHRLFLKDFESHYAADMEMEKLQKVTSSAFILEENGRYAIYAGSYLHERGAAVEQKRLAGKGFNLSLKAAKVMIQVTRVTAGSFSSSADARKEANRLEQQGIIASVIKTGK